MNESILPTPVRMRRTARVLLAIGIAWGLLVTWAAASGSLQRFPLPSFAGLVALGILAPVALYAAWPAGREWVQSLGLLPMGLLHVWRVPAALLFFYYGAQGALPAPFWLLAGVGDFIAGVLAWRLLQRPADLAAHWRFHTFGFADFVVAVGTGLTYTLLQDPRMQLLATLPMALIPLFGVGLSGAAHLVGFHMLWLRRASVE